MRACRAKVRGQVGEDRRACPARGELNGPRTRLGTLIRLPREAEVGEEVRVGVGVRVGTVEFKLYCAAPHDTTRHRAAHRNAPQCSGVTKGVWGRDGQLPQAQHAVGRKTASSTYFMSVNGHKRFFDKFGE